MSKKAAKNRCGRTSNGGYVRYSPEYAPYLYQYLANGKTVFDFCFDLGCSRSSLYQWIKKYPEFNETFKEGREAGKPVWLKRCLIPDGKLPNTSFHRLLTTNIYGRDVLPPQNKRVE
jgi:hypothetical protein